MKPIRSLSFSIGTIAVALSFSQIACLEDVCENDGNASPIRAALTSREQINDHQILTLAKALGRDGRTLSEAQSDQLKRDGQLFGMVRLDRPIKHPNGAVEMPEGWLRPLKGNHPWASKLTPRDNAYFSWVQERVLLTKLYDPQNPEQLEAVERYLAKAKAGETFSSWTYADVRMECPRKRCMPPNASVCLGDAATTVMPTN